MIPPQPRHLVRTGSRRPDRSNTCRRRRPPAGRRRHRAPAAGCAGRNRHGPRSRHRHRRRVRRATCNSPRKRCSTTSVMCCWPLPGPAICGSATGPRYKPSSPSQVLLGDLGELLVDRSPPSATRCFSAARRWPCRASFPRSRSLNLTTSRRSHRRHLRVAPEIADQDDFIDAARHGFRAFRCAFCAATLPRPSRRCCPGPAAVHKRQRSGYVLI